MTPWFYSPFKSEKERLPRVLLNQVFEWLWKGPLGSLKGRWHILFKKIDMPF
jgi:hypothetical protein